MISLLVVLATVAPVAPAVHLAAAQSAPGQAYRESIAGTLVTFDLVPVPGGTVTLDGKPVTVEPFYISRTEVTWDLFDVFALGLDTPKGRDSADAIARPSQPYGAPDYGWGHAGYPVISVTRAAAQALCEWLSAKTGKPYRLPTEAEWVRAAQLAAGPGALTADRREAIAWHRGNAAAKVHPVGAKRPDALGLFDLFGNAAEWVTTSDGQLVARGGSFRDRAESVGPDSRVVQDESWNERDPQIPKSRWWLSDGPFVGFRVVTDTSLPKLPKVPKLPELPKLLRRPESPEP